MNAIESQMGKRHGFEIKVSRVTHRRLDGRVVALEIKKNMPMARERGLPIWEVFFLEKDESRHVALIRRIELDFMGLSLETVRQIATLLVNGFDNGDDAP